MKNLYNNTLATLFFTTVISFVASKEVKAQVALTNMNTYTQNFNGLTSSTALSWFMNNSTIPGWYLQHESYNYPYFPIYANDGTNTDANFYSFGKSGSTDRALGGMATGINTGSGYVGFRVKNNTGQVIRNFEISYAFEQWYNSGNEAKFDFSYATKPVGQEITSLLNNSANWLHVDEMDVITPSTSSPVGPKDGNADAHRIVKKFTVIEINLQPGQEIMLRWQYVTVNSTSGNGLALEDVSVTPQVNVFYAKEKGRLDDKSTWARNLNGSGGSPTDFYLADQVFHITKGISREINGKLDITGINSKIVLGNGIDSVELVVAAGKPFKGIIDVSNKATLIIEAGSTPLLGDLADESTVVYDLDGEQALNSSVFGNLILSGTGNKILTADILVNGNLTLKSSHLILGNFNATVHKTKSVIGGSATGYIVTNGTGQLWLTVPRTDTEVIFPIGNITYNPVILKQGQYGAEDVFKVRVVEGIYASYDADGNPTGEAQTGNAVSKTWLVKESTVGGSDLTMTVNWSQDDALPEFYDQTAYVSHFENGNWDTTDPGMANNSNMYSLTRSGITSFSPFGVYSSESTLPVEIIGFEAVYNGKSVDLSWETANETNNDYFTIEYSLDAKTFSKVASVKGAGNSQHLLNYSYSDKRTLRGQVYYRLRQTDFDGKSSYSSVASVFVPGFYSIKPYPNPTRDILHINTDFNDVEEVKVSISDMAGNPYYLSKATMVATNHFKIDLSALVPNMYIIKVQSATDTKLYRVAKM